MLLETVSNTSRIRKTGVVYSFVSAWEDDDHDLMHTLASIAGDMKTQLDGLKTEASTKDTMVTIDGKEINLSVIVAGIQSFIGIIQSGLSHIAGSTELYMGEQTFLGKRSNFFGKYDPEQLKKSVQHVEYTWRVTLE